MHTILAAAGVPESALKLVASVCDSCSICRQWQRPGNKSIATAKLSTQMNQTVQMDLLFVSAFIILHLLDEATIFSMLIPIPNKQADTICSAIQQNWIRLLGAPRTLVSDREGGLVGETASVWAERWSVNLLLRAPSQHATMVERHHELCRQIIHRLVAQCKSEGLIIDFNDIVAESMLAQRTACSLCPAPRHSRACSEGDRHCCQSQRCQVSAS